MNASQTLVQENLNREMLETGQIERHVEFHGHLGAILGFAPKGPVMAPDDEIIRQAFHKFQPEKPIPWSQ